MVFVDEVHRFNKAQQDAFLPHVESGLFTFIGATTENPSFEVNSALLSRATVHVLKPLEPDDLIAAAGARAGLAAGAAPLTDAARDRLIGYADGDARRLLNAYENLVRDGGRRRAVASTKPMLEQRAGRELRRYDKGGEQFYDPISALHKSVRGSDPDAALYWLARMLDGGVDPRYVARRLVRMASEDIGLADPRALRMALDAAEVYERLGSPEGELALAQAVVYLAIAPKSNAVYTAWNAVREFVRAGRHAAGAAAPAQCADAADEAAGLRQGLPLCARRARGVCGRRDTTCPRACAPQRFYEPVPRGLEQRIAEKLAQLRGAQRRGAAKRAPDCAVGAQRLTPSQLAAAQRVSPALARNLHSYNRAVREGAHIRAAAAHKRGWRWTSFSSRSSTVWCWAACTRWSRWATRWSTASST